MTQNAKEKEQEYWPSANYDREVIFNPDRYDRMTVQRAALRMTLRVTTSEAETKQAMEVM